MYCAYVPMYVHIVYIIIIYFHMFVHATLAYVHIYAYLICGHKVVCSTLEYLLWIYSVDLGRFVEYLRI
jgi:hypothetical protein